MTTPGSIDPLRLRRTLGRAEWQPPTRFGPDGWLIQRSDREAAVIVTAGEESDGHEWIHASMSCPDRMPDYDDLALMHRAVFGGGWAYQVFAPPADHVNIHEHCLHLWGRLDGSPALPCFAVNGMI